MQSPPKKQTSQPNIAVDLRCGQPQTGLAIGPNGLEANSAPPSFTPDLSGLQALATALQARLEVSPKSSEATLTLPSNSCTQSLWQNELLLRTGIAMDQPVPSEKGGELQLNVPLHLPMNQYHTAAKLVQERAFFFWQRMETMGTL